MAYTYNEPLVGYEFLRDAAQAVRERGMVNVLVTNATIEEAPWRALLPHRRRQYRPEGLYPGLVPPPGRRPETVKRAIAIAAQSCHLEVTTLLVPGENDGEAEIAALARWLAGIDPAIPLHLSRFFPRHRMADKPPTPVETVYRLARTARTYLTYVYTGNC